MAASASTAFAAVAGSTSLEISTLSSKAAFGTSCNVVQGAPMARASAARVGAIRASNNNSEEARPARREVMAGILAAGAALGFSNQASAAMNPVATAKSKADQAVQGAKDLAGSNMPSMNPVGDAQNLVDEAGAGIKRRIDGLFGKNKPYPQRNTQVTGKGAIADAKNRVDNFLNKSQNPLATNLEKATEETASGLGSATGPNSASARAGKEILGQDSTRVDEATARLNAGAEKLQGKAVQAFDDAKGAAAGAVGAAKDATPDVNAPSLPSLPSAPSGSGLFKSLGSKVESAKSDIASKAEDAKSMLPGQ